MSKAPHNPKMFYVAHPFVCVNVREPGHPRGCCAEKGSKELHGYMKARSKELGIKNIRVNQSGCLDRCELGPNVLIQPEGVWYQMRTKADVDEILQKHIIEGGRVERLMLEPTDKLPKDAEARRTKTAAE
jgi:(2Fe-2S) ferredoxin